MVIQELTAEECRDVLQRARIVRLAAARDNQPYIVPIHVYPDGDYLYSFSTLGQKIDWMRQNPKVCVEVEDVADRYRWTTVLGFGEYEELVHTRYYEAFRERARELFRNRPEWWQPAATQTQPNDFRMPVIYRIRVERVSGRVASRSEVPAEEDDANHPWWLGLMYQPARDTQE